ncbi:hypothetical protein CP532_6119 [Ophiocordyceps camponoti-leonardi (nom. inval.)]|nr:hypothetical protein CP532_6119 [Ophiocordyceps camponoti-leonardi (nom. inval.)]
MSVVTDPAGYSIQALIEEIERLKRVNEHLEQKLTDFEGCDTPLTDDKVQKWFESVYDAIQSWVASIECDYSAKGLDFQELLQHILERDGKTGLLHRLGLRNDVDALPGSRNSAAYERFHERMRWLRRHWSGVQVVLFRLLWCSLYDSVFNGPYPLGMSYEVEKGSSSRANTWKAFSMRFFTDEDTSFEESKQQKMNQLLLRIHDDILSHVPIETSIWKKRLPQLKESVVLPAVELKQALACSLIEYHIREPRDLARCQVDRWDAEIVKCKLMDASNLEEFKLFDDAVFVITCVFPGIYKGSEDEEGISIVKPVLMVCDKDPAHSRDAKERARGKSHSSSSIITTTATYRDLSARSVSPLPSGYRRRTMPPQNRLPAYSWTLFDWPLFRSRDTGQSSHPSQYFCPRSKSRSRGSTEPKSRKYSQARSRCESPNRAQLRAPMASLSESTSPSCENGDRLFQNPITYDGVDVKTNAANLNRGGQYLGEVYDSELKTSGAQRPENSGRLTSQLFRKVEWSHTSRSKGLNPEELQR